MVSLILIVRGSGHNSPGLPERSERPKGSRRITAGQEKFLRKLLHVLSEIVDEKGHFDDDDGNGLFPVMADCPVYACLDMESSKIKEVDFDELGPCSH